VLDYYLTCNSAAVTLLCGLKTGDRELVSLFHSSLFSHDVLKLILSYCLFVGVDIIYTGLCLTFIRELCVPIMADGLGWVGLRNLDP